MFKSQVGQTLIELLLAIGLMAVFIPALVSGIAASQSGKAQQAQRLQALQLLKEGEEAVRAIRNEDWANVATNGVFHPVIGGSDWNLSPGSPPIDGFVRSITISDVFRNSGGLIASTGTLDPSFKKIDIEVSWNSPLSSSVSSTVYLSRYLNNASFIDTSVNDFKKAGSIPTSVQAISPSSDNNSSDGQIRLSQSGVADWCDPGQPITQLNLSGQALARSVVAGVDRAYVGTGQNASGKAFYNVVIDNSLNPPPASELGTYDDSALKTNSVFGETHYAYLGVNVNANRQVVIIDVDPNIPTPVGTVLKQGNDDTNSVFVSNTTLFFTAGSTLYTFDIQNRTNPSFRDKFNLNGNATGNKIYVLGNYVYVALDSTSNQLQIVDATNPDDLKNPGGGGPVLLKVNNQRAQDVFVKADGSRAYLVTSSSSSESNFFIINVEDPGSPSTFGTGYKTDPMDPKGLTVIDNRAIIVGFTDPRYQVLKIKDINNNDIYDECKRMNEPSDIYSVSSIAINGHAYSYIVTDDAGSEFQIIEGGLGGAGTYTSSGTYESATSWPALTLPATNPIAFNRFDVTYVKPPGTNIQLQVAVGNEVSGGCNSFSYVGPGQPPTAGSFSTGAGNGNNPVTESFTIPFGSNGSGYQNPSKCFRYKINLSTSDPNTTPAINDATINYSP